MVNFELYKIFVIVANEHSMEKASTVLNLTPSAVTKNIKLLEKTLKIKLFKKIDSNLLLTDLGKELYKQLKNPIHDLIYIDNKFSDVKTINVGSHSYLFNKFFNNCTNQFTLEYPKVNLNFNDFETNEMLQALSNKELDIVFSKKVSDLNLPNLKFIKLGYLNDIFIVNKDSDLSGKVLNINDLKNEIIYTPKSYSQSLNRLISIFDIQQLNLKCSNYENILETVNASHSIGFVTKEYLEKGALEQYNLIELQTELNLPPVEFGIYLSNSRFKELNDLVRVIKSHFFFKHF